ncbi:MULTISPECIES: hypothetical protein [Streptomyces]|uniref:Regulatory protein n=1 Tax=Streptomyces griseus subsp. griseus (strain JCM 4626 / CBS 651.72 / NBRC 13350 / KCC S-0626 / ISP 5235) TaxID=455632 RepID=B1VNA2_STRGG|nr:hypothetical protein [Streptomyces griseus]KUJ69759.1 hypothetical protein ACZ90_08860 [Streptomyces albus subsp. albus]MBW3709625.1 hypothetical protein [Streptomyces griseus]SEE22122.1 hypothetical protein SAMN04490359_2243 [Streptomyces griseus]SQA26674.1 regulatory protein [Streptomyces griseus]BAG16925.1 hypothetical protein SGR_96t [Streptomyces griseus subsp. griseus NBRC 13350]
MSGNLPAQSVTADYAQRVADDLAANRSDQERVRTELARLQDELVRLEDSEQVLTKMQDVLGGMPKQTAKQRKDRKGASVPAARGSNRKTAAGKPAAAAGRKASKKTVSPKKAGEPTWLELTTAYLGGQSEPRSAAEVAASLTEAHPERTVQVTVVRNSLEQGVAQGLLERSKQGRSVFYSPTAPASAPSGS